MYPQLLKEYKKMKNSDLQKIGQKRAFIHLFVFPIALFTIMYFIDKHYCLVVSLGYIIIITLLEFLRLITTEDHKRIYSQMFFKVLKKLLALAFIAIVLLLIGVVV